MSDLHYFRPDWIKPCDTCCETDVCIYGGTAGGVFAAVAAARRGRSVVLVNPGHTLGGMTTGGLGWTDFGKKHVIGGMARQFYRDLGKHYGKEEEWHFEPHAAQQVIDRMIGETDVIVHHRQFLDRVKMQSGRIVEIGCLGGLRVKAAYFIDATYEGDLMAKAGVTYTTGRESNTLYDETLNGVQVREYHQFSHAVDPYVEPGNPASGTLPFVSPQDALPDGSGDKRIQAYCFRVCMTDDPTIRVPWPKPTGYDPGQYVLASRWYNAPKDTWNEPLRDNTIRKMDRLFVSHKTDTNNHGAVSSDFIGGNYAWPEGDYQTREAIFQNHVTYQQGFYWFMANDTSIPARYRDVYASFGLAADEYPHTGHWPHQLYVREARRMVSAYVLTEHDCRLRSGCDDPVGMGSYQMDSHNCQRFVRNGRVLNEGDVQIPPAGPYGISYRCIVPRRGECENLAVVICVSTSHIAYGSVRMEPVFMLLGESAAIAVDLAMSAKVPLQDLPYNEIRPELENAGQVLSSPQAGAETATT